MNIFKKIIKIIGKIILIILTVIIALLLYFNFPVFTENKDSKLGVTFSKRYAEDIQLNWKETYTAMLDDLKIRKIRIPVYWDLAEPEEGKYDATLSLAPIADYLSQLLGQKIRFITDWLNGVAQFPEEHCRERPLWRSVSSGTLRTPRRAFPPGEIVPIGGIEFSV